MMQIEFAAVTKAFGPTRANDGLDLRIERGDRFALLGHNGAGKTTALRLLLGLLRRDSGKISVFGLDPDQDGPAIRRFCGVLAEAAGLYEPLSVYDNLALYGQLYGMSRRDYERRIDELLEIFEIADQKNAVIRGFSTGMKQKVAIARALLASPELILLDEPTNGLDPVAVERLRELLLGLARDGATIIMTTHNLAQVQKTCSRLAILRHGKAIYADEVDHLLSTHPNFDLEEFYLQLESDRAS